MDGLENIVAEAEHYDRQTESAQQFKPVDEQGGAAAVVAGISPTEAAGNMAESVLSLGFGLMRMVLDSRLVLADEEKECARNDLSPVIEKYNLAMGGTGRLPWHEEIIAGLYLGGLYKRIKRALGELRAADKAKREAKEQANQQANGNTYQANDYYGKEREYAAQEQPHAVSSDIGLRQESNLNPNERFF